MRVAERITLQVGRAALYAPRVIRSAASANARYARSGIWPAPSMHGYARRQQVRVARVAGPAGPPARFGNRPTPVNGCPQRIVLRSPGLGSDESAHRSGTEMVGTTGHRRTTGPMPAGDRRRGGPGCPVDASRGPIRRPAGRSRRLRAGPRSQQRGQRARWDIRARGGRVIP